MSDTQQHSLVFLDGRKGFWSRDEFLTMLANDTHLSGKELSVLIGRSEGAILAKRQRNKILLDNSRQIRMFKELGFRSHFPSHGYTRIQNKLAYRYLKKVTAEQSINTEKDWLDIPELWAFVDTSAITNTIYIEAIEQRKNRWCDRWLSIVYVCEVCGIPIGALFALLNRSHRRIYYFPRVEYGMLSLRSLKSLGRNTFMAASQLEELLNKVKTNKGKTVPVKRKRTPSSFIINCYEQRHWTPGQISSSTGLTISQLMAVLPVKAHGITLDLAGNAIRRK